MFKLYVDDLKSRYHEDKKQIKEVLKEKKFELELGSTLEQFTAALGSCADDKRLQGLDAANIKLAYASLMEKCEQREHERQKDELKRVRKQEQAFRNLLKQHEVNETAKWAEVKLKLVGDAAFAAMDLEDRDGERMFDEYLAQLQEACLHHVKKKKEKKKSKSSRRSRSNSVDEAAAVAVEGLEDGEETPLPPAKRKDVDDEEMMDGDEKDAHNGKSKKHHKKSKKRKKQRSVCVYQSFHFINQICLILYIFEGIPKRNG